MRDIIGYGGGKSGGGGSSSPVESADSLHSTAYARVLDLVSEGEIGGLVNGAASIFLDDTPLQNADGSLNFSNVSIDTRVGTQDQEYIAGFPSVESERAVGVTLTTANPWTRAVTNTALSALRLRLSVPALSKANTSNGDIGGYRVEYLIELSTDGGSFQQVLTGAFDGKTTTKYERSHRVELPKAATGWQIRVRRLTLEANSNTIADTTYIESMTEIVDAKLRYPNSAIVALQIDARQFSGVPKRAFDLYGRLLRVPSNYSPDTRTYSGVWDGTFKIAWSNNPAWVFYDLALHKRYGLGDRIDAGMLDKWSLYEIAQYCDQPVSDGKGGLEPRFTCNVYLQSRADAYKVLQDIAAIFRGMVFWGSGAAVAVADMPQDPVYTYTPANVIGGKFNYVGTRRSTRYTAANVSWNDPANRYEARVEHVEDADGIVRYGVQLTEITAFGCSSQGQAQRAGQWILLTSRYENETLTFKVGLDSLLVAPGSVVRIADPARSGRRIGGRLRSATSDTVTVDAADSIAVGDSLTVALPSGVTETRTIQAVDGRDLRVSEDWSEEVQPEAIWAVDSATLKTQLFRIVSVADATSSNSSSLEFEITAIKHEPGKYANIDNGTRIDSRPVTVIPPSVQPPPTDVAVSSYSAIVQGIAVTTAVFSWTAAKNAVAYDAEWRRDNSDWVRIPRTGACNVEVPNVYAGGYVVRVRAINAMDVASAAAYSVQTQLNGKTTPPPKVTFLSATGKVFAIDLAWGFPEGAQDTERTEIWYSETPSFEDALKLGDFAYPQNTHSMIGLSAGKTFFFWARLIDKTGNIGDWYPEGNGVQGQSSADADAILDYLTGQITKTQLGQDLLAPIEAVEGVGETLEEITAGMDDVQQRMDTLQGAFARVDGQMAGSDEQLAGNNNVYAGAWSEQHVRAEHDMALGQRIDVVAAKIENIDFSEIEAFIRDEATARADGDGALAERITTVQASVDDNVAAVQVHAEAISMLNGKMSASYSVKVGLTQDGKYYGAGMAIGIDNSSEIAQSQILFQADRFALLNVANGVVTSPFAIQGGQVFISQALIGNGWITNAMIGEYIQSNNYVANSVGWRIDKSGVWENNGSIAGTGRLKQTNQLIQVFDPNGAEALRLGIW